MRTRTGGGTAEIADRRVIALVVVAIATFLAVAPPAAAIERPSTECVSTPTPDKRGVGAEMPCPSNQGVRLDRDARVLSATVYQHAAVAGLVGGAIVVGALAGGVHTALVAGAAVFVAYMFIP